MIDAFTNQANFLLQFGQYMPYAISRLEDVREASGYAPRLICLPQANQLPVQIGGCLLYQTKLPIGTVLLGFVFTGVNAEWIQISETMGRSLFSEPVPIAVFQNTPDFPILFPEPFTMANSGELNVQIYNPSLFDTDPPTVIGSFEQLQMVVLCAEPLNKQEPCTVA